MTVTDVAIHGDVPSSPVKQLAQSLPEPFNLHTMLLDVNGDDVIGTLTRHGIERLRDNGAQAGVSLNGSVCYVLYNAVTSRVKIGQSDRFHRRWRSLEMGSGCHLHPLVLWQTDRPGAVEARLHQMFRDARGVGEWFEASAVIPALLDACRRAVMSDEPTSKDAKKATPASIRPTVRVRTGDLKRVDTALGRLIADNRTHMHAMQEALESKRAELGLEISSKELKREKRAMKVAAAFRDRLLREGPMALTPLASRLSKHQRDVRDMALQYGEDLQWFTYIKVARDAEGVSMYWPLINGNPFDPNNSTVP
ncbi:MAG: hypothetical protein E6R04_08965 [Spirochaetes bacterium]|nr:MAG: hypothetical protein E6R04_08965 [Spirochaetota bacterium]